MPRASRNVWRWETPPKAQRVKATIDMFLAKIINEYCGLSNGQWGSGGDSMVISWLLLLVDKHKMTVYFCLNSVHEKVRPRLPKVGHTLHLGDFMIPAYYN